MQTACSTSLVAVCSAVQSLLSYQCDMALAGGVSVTFPQQRGYLYQEGGIISPDGHCRAFDARRRRAQSSATASASWCSAARDALADGDTIYAVIKGAALNNDGSRQGRASPRRASTGRPRSSRWRRRLPASTRKRSRYVEAHGTGTPLGDPDRDRRPDAGVPRGGARANGFCAIGSVKTNIGHLDAAAGVAGLIKTVLALSTTRSPAEPALRRRRTRSRLRSTARSTSTRSCDLEGRRRRRAAPASARSASAAPTRTWCSKKRPPREPAAPARAPSSCCVLSARTRDGARARGRTVCRIISADDRTPTLADVAYTLQVGRRASPTAARWSAATATRRSRLLAQPDPKRVFSGHRASERRGASRSCSPARARSTSTWAAGSTRPSRVFRERGRRCAEILRPHSASDLRDVLYPTEDGCAQRRQLDADRDHAAGAVRRSSTRWRSCG